MEITPSDQMRLLNEARGLLTQETWAQIQTEDAD